MSQQKANQITLEGRAGAGEAVLLFARFPEPGKVKTRLAAAIGAEQAAELHGLFVLDLFRRLSAAGFSVTLCHTPASRGPDFARMLPGAGLAAQEGRDLGERMAQAFREAFARGARAALCLGSDLPDIPLDALAEAFIKIHRGSPVLGPAEDGGYWCIGFSPESFTEAAFYGIPWGGPQVFARTLGALAAAGRTPFTLPSWQDVDTIEDLRLLAARQEKAPVLSEKTLALVKKFA